MLRIGDVFRVTSPANLIDEYIEGIKNYYYETTVPGHPLFNFRMGINKSSNITDINGISRCPVIVIDSSPSSSGTNDNPWRDEFYPDRGVIRYYGDNKVFEKQEKIWIGKPEGRGNKFLLEQLRICQSGSREERFLHAVPLVFFEKSSSGRSLRKFQGYGVVENAELVTQYDIKHNLYFPNYLFTFCVFSMSSVRESFDWGWIAKRCDPKLTAHDVYRNAPEEWKKWINLGNEKNHLVRRKVSSFSIVMPENQMVSRNSDDERLLKAIYQYYQGRKHDFEYLALEVARKTIEESGTSVTPGWVTPKSNDHGIDFVLRVNIGSDKLSGLQIVAIGQAKCEDPNGTTSALAIARTVARLKRGWIAVLVTLQAVSKAVQEEVNEDQYPIMLINGKKVVEVVARELFKSRLSLEEYLASLKSSYMIENKKPEDILL